MNYIDVYKMKKQAAQLIKEPTPTPPPTLTYHTIAKGDTMQGLDKWYNLPIGSFEKANPNINYNRLQIGQRVNIPVMQTAPAQRPGASVSKPAAKAVYPRYKASVTKTAPKASYKSFVARQSVPQQKFVGDQRFYNAIRFAETGSEKNPWIRTRVAPKGGSSAFGPVQITRGKASDYFDRFPSIMSGSAEFYNTTMAPMYANFLKYGREPNKPGYEKRWDYGGYGQHLTPAQQESYRQMGLAMMEADAQEARRLLPKGSDEELLLKRIELWRGVPYNEDPKYYNKVLSYYRNNK